MKHEIILTSFMLMVILEDFIHINIIVYYSSRDRNMIFFYVSGTFFLPKLISLVTSYHDCLPDVANQIDKQSMHIRNYEFFYEYIDKFKKYFK